MSRHHKTRKASINRHVLLVSSTYLALIINDGAAKVYKVTQLLHFQVSKLFNCSRQINVINQIFAKEILFAKIPTKIYETSPKFSELLLKKISRH